MYTSEFSLIFMISCNLGSWVKKLGRSMVGEKGEKMGGNDSEIRPYSLHESREV
jgi:hypothetical protein